MSATGIDLPRHRLTVDEYYRMAEVGILAPDARVELIEGEIIDMPPQGSGHAFVTSTLTRRFIEAVGTAADVRCQMPIHLSEWSEPEPDLAVVKPRGAHYARHHPLAEDVLLLVEVAASSRSYDRAIKPPLYARHGIPELWLIDLGAQRLRVFRAPCRGTYTDARVRQLDGRMSIHALPGPEIDLSGLA